MKNRYLFCLFCFLGLCVSRTAAGQALYGDYVVTGNLTVGRTTDVKQLTVTGWSNFNERLFMRHAAGNWSVDCNAPPPPVFLCQLW